MRGDHRHPQAGAVDPRSGAPAPLTMNHLRPSLHLARQQRPAPRRAGSPHAAGLCRGRRPGRREAGRRNRRVPTEVHHRPAASRSGRGPSGRVWCAGSGGSRASRGLHGICSTSSSPKPSSPAASWGCWSAVAPCSRRGRPGSAHRSRSRGRRPAARGRGWRQHVAAIVLQLVRGSLCISQCRAPRGHACRHDSPALRRWCADRHRAGPQSQRCEPNTSPVRHSECTRTSTSVPRRCGRAPGRLFRAVDQAAIAQRAELPYSWAPSRGHRWTWRLGAPSPARSGRRSTPGPGVGVRERPQLRRRAIVPSSLTSSAIAPAGLSPASRAKSTEASVWPGRTSRRPGGSAAGTRARRAARAARSPSRRAPGSCARGRPPRCRSSCRRGRRPRPEQAVPLRSSVPPPSSVAA